MASAVLAEYQGVKEIRRLQLPDKLPEINDLINIAFPMWEVDDAGNRVEKKPCTVNSCEWNPFYITKRYDGLHPDLGGHPSDLDVQYAFFGGSPFNGQPYPGTPHHCPLDAPDDIKAGDCPKLAPLTDNGPDGPGHVPPHIALASLTWAVQDSLFSLDEMFSKDNCRVVPDVLLQMIRNYYPRTEGEKVDYPPPIVPEGGDFQYEFPAGNGLDNQFPPYAPGPPHWCTEAMLASGHWDGVCPYVFEGPDAGKYRHPHIAYAALEVYLANIAMPDECSATWLQNNPFFLDPNRVTTDTPFPVMENDDAPADTVENWLGQPVLPWDYDSGDARDTSGSFEYFFFSSGSGKGKGTSGSYGAGKGKGMSGSFSSGSGKGKGTSGTGGSGSGKGKGTRGSGSGSRSGKGTSGTGGSGGN